MGGSLKLKDIIFKSGELIWDAGPLVKGNSVCHGNGGSGLAFLKLYLKTKDQKWLHRAREFAMHGIHSNKKVDDYSLWCGELGFAIFLLNCIDKNIEFPFL